MVASISSSTVSNWSDSLFNKLDTKKQGYIDASDLASALGTDSTDTSANSTAAADMMKQIDSDGDGKITQSELSTAVSKVADQLNAQFDSSRVDKSQAGTPPDGPPPAPPAGATATTGADTTDSADSTDEALNVSASSTSSTKGAAPAGGGASASAASSSDTNKYVQAADTDANGKVSDDEAAAYKKLMAAQAEKSGHTHAHGHHGGGGKAEQSDSGDSTSSTDSTSTSSTSSSDRDLSRALDMLKQYVSNSGDTSSATSTSASVSVTA